MGLTTSQLAQAVEINSETLRYYESRGLLPEPPRNASGYRLYPVQSVERLRFIKGAQALGFTLDEIKELLSLRANDRASKREVREQALQKVEQIEEKIDALETMRDALRHLIGQCSGDGPTSDCPILDGMTTHGIHAHSSTER
ncbi:MAG: MerR family DNA-binding protein [Anaerolineales bacterium]|nr:MerR family DNA-binding protein [Anaerolineales bacterium]MCB9126944.1 MerR family DNA-binding protein [Ardenticatenales bacterium]MCB9171489.1 MerR family DNA-binding protein [Ardenticatenales bacterium]